MKTIVSIQEISEFEIKPHVAFDEWRNLVKNEISTRWKDRSDWKKVSCPTCSNDNTTSAFEIYGFVYEECTNCGTLFSLYRPTENDLWSWYCDSKPSHYWNENLLPSSEKFRLEKIVNPRATWILDCLAEYNPTAKRLVDVSHNGRGLINLIAKADTKFKEIISAGMRADLEGKSENNVSVKPIPIAKLGDLGPADVVVAIDTFDRCPDLSKLIDSFKKLLPPGGLVFATVAVSSGFEIQTLWDKSPTIIPPDKLNLPSVKGLKLLFSKPEWEILELSTPGMFDVETVYRTLNADQSSVWPRGIKGLIQHLNAEERTTFIEFLQSLSLTSFARIVVRKVGI